MANRTGEPRCVSKLLRAGREEERSTPVRNRKQTCEQGEEEELQLPLDQVHKDIPPAVQHPLLGLIHLEA